MMHAVARLAVAAVLVIGCSAGDEADDSGDGDGRGEGDRAVGAVRDACSLITKAEADAIVGSTFTVQPRAISDDKSACDYGPGVGPAGQTYQGFTVEVYWKDGEEAIEIGRRAAGMATDAAGGSGDEVANNVMGLRRLEGLGDEAYFSGRTMSYVRKGDVTLEFQLGGLDNPTPEHLRALATAALGRIPG